MTAATLRRVARMPLAELSFRVRGLMRVHADRWRVRTVGSRWERGDISRVISPSFTTAALTEAVEGKNWLAADAALLAMLGVR